MRLSAFIRSHMEPILQEWEDFARSIQPPQRAMDVAELRDHAKEMLEEIAVALARAESSSDEQPRGAAGARAAEIHAETRIQSGFNIEQLVAEYRALRASVLRLWARREKTATWFELEDMSRFNAAIDQALADSISHYSQTMNRSRDIFLGILGHDLRTPLHTLSLGAATLMRAKGTDANLIQLGARMFRSTSRMTHIIDNLLDFTAARIGGGLTISLQPADLSLVAEHIADEFRFSSPEREIAVSIHGNTAGVWDAARIGQVLQNLIGNALQYGAADAPVSVSIRDNGETVELEVHNYGPPIPAAHLDHLFDPLYRHAKGEGEGFGRKNLGLGLYIVRQIVTAHHGNIRVASSPERGTAFNVHLPRDAAR